ncbi:MAG TPA: DUF4397 domain-containing protein [Chloroflexi bacterium]|nr:DUF4397 domain-containing protein [Chloroflexota bacterium]
MNRLTRRFNPLWVFGSVAAVAIAVFGLALSADSSPAYFQFVHLSPDSPALDLYIDSTLYESGLEFGQAGAVRTTGGSGYVTVAVRLAGTSPASTPILTAEINLHPGATHIVAVANELADLQIGNYQVPNAGLIAAHGRLQFLHAIPGGPRIDVKTGQGVLLVNDLGYLEDPPYTDLPSGEFRLLGTTETSPSVLLFDETYTLEENTVYTLIVTGQPIQTILITTQAGQPGIATATPAPTTAP